MNFKFLSGTALILAMATGPTFAQSNDVKGWTPKPKPPVAGSGDNGPKTITRGANDPAPAPGPAPGVAPNPNPPAQNPPAAAFDILLANDPVAIQKAMMDAGYRAELSQDNDGNPKIIGTASRSTYWILFLDCQASSGCLGVEFYVSYALDQKPSLDAVNKFNADYRYVRAFTNSKGDPRMMMDVLMRDGGLDKKTFLEYLRLWTIIMPEFEKMIGA